MRNLNFNEEVSLWGGIMVRREVKANRTKSGKGHSIKTYMLQDKVDQRVEQEVERVEEIFPSSEGQANKNPAVEEGKPSTEKSGKTTKDGKRERKGNGRGRR